MVRVFHNTRDGSDGTPPGVNQLEHVAEVYALEGLAVYDQLSFAVEQTQHPMGGTWRNNPTVTPLSSSYRSTYYGDVLECNGEFYLYWYILLKNGTRKKEQFEKLDKDYYASFSLPVAPLEPRLPVVTKGCGFEFDF